MEKFSPQPPEESGSGIAKKVMLGAVLAGAAGGLSACKEGDVSEVKTGEPEPIRAEAQQESAERQAQDFITEIGAMDVGFDDARGRATLRPVIETKFDSFTTNVFGKSTMENRAQAAELLLAEFPELTSDSSFSLQVLSIVLSQYDMTPDQQEAVEDFADEVSGSDDTEVAPGRGHKQGGEVRTILDSNW